MIWMQMDETTVDAVAELETVCFTEPWSKESLRGELENPMAVWIVAMDERYHVVAGYGGMHVLLGEGNVMNVAVAPQYRRMGIGQELVRRLLKLAQDVEQVFLEVRVSNAAAIALYQKAGFVPISIRKGYYQNPKEDAWIMRRTRRE